MINGNGGYSFYPLREQKNLPVGKSQMDENGGRHIKCIKVGFEWRR
jgi:hypothetical protein